MQDQEVAIKNNLVLQAIGAAPSSGMTATVVSGAGLGIGAYLYAVTFTSTDGESLGSPTVGATTTSGNQKVNLGAIPTGPTGTTGRKVYRTVVGGSQLKLLTTLADNTTTTFADTTADGSLGANIPTAPSFGGALILKDQTGAVKGTLYNDGTMTFTASATSLLLNNNVAVQSKDTGGTVRNLIFEDGSNNLVLGTGGGNVATVEDSTGAFLARFGTAATPGVTYAAGTGFNISEGITSPTNGFVLGRLAGQNNTILAALGTTSAIGFKQGGINGTRLAEMKTNGDFIIANATYWTKTATFNFSANGAYDGGFDLAEMAPVDELYPNGTVVCPGDDGRLHRCSHDGCEYAMLISTQPAFCAGGGTWTDEIPDDEPLPRAQPVALAGRIAMPAYSRAKLRDWITSDGTGGVRSVRWMEHVYALGYVLGISKGRILVHLRGKLT